MGRARRPRKGDYLRYLYRSGRPNAWARWQNRLTARMASAGIWPRRMVTLEVVGRRTGRAVTLPLVLVEHDGDRFLVSMLGEGARWVANVRAAHGRAALVHGRREEVRLEEVPVALRAPILRRYLAVAPGGRPHIPVDRRAPLTEFAGVAADYPVFRIHPA